MADLLIVETENISTLVSEENEKLGDIVSLWLKKGEEGECLLNVVPWKMTNDSDDHITSKGALIKSFERKLYFRPDNFDFEGVDIAKELFYKRLDLNFSVSFSYGTEEKENGKKSYYIKIFTDNAYIPEDAMKKIRDKITSLSDPYDVELLAGKSAKLPNEMKPMFLQKATDIVTDFMMEHAKPEIIEVIKATEAYCKERFC